MYAAEIRLGSSKPGEEKIFEFKSTGMVFVDRLFADAEKIVVVYPTDKRMLQLAKSYYETVLAVQITDELRRKCVAEINAINEKLGPTAFYASGLKYAELNFQHHVKEARDAFDMARIVEAKSHPASALCKLCEQNIAYLEALVLVSKVPPATVIKTWQQQEEEYQQFVKSFYAEIPYQAKLLDTKDAGAKCAVDDYREGLHLLEKKDFTNARSAFLRAEVYYKSGLLWHKYLSKSEAQNAQNRCDIMIRHCLLEMARDEFQDEKDEKKVSLRIGKQYPELLERTIISLTKKEGPHKLSLVEESGQLYFFGKYESADESFPSSLYKAKVTHKEKISALDYSKFHNYYDCRRLVTINSLQEIINLDLTTLVYLHKDEVERKVEVARANQLLHSALERLRAHDINNLDNFLPWDNSFHLAQLHTSKIGISILKNFNKIFNYALKKFKEGKFDKSKLEEYEKQSNQPEDVLSLLEEVNQYDKSIYPEAYALRDWMFEEVKREQAEAKKLAEFCQDNKASIDTALKVFNQFLQAKIDVWRSSGKSMEDRDRCFFSVKYMIPPDQFYDQYRPGAVMCLAGKFFQGDKNFADANILEGALLQAMGLGVEQKVDQGWVRCSIPLNLASLSQLAKIPKIYASYQREAAQSFPSAAKFNLQLALEEFSSYPDFKEIASRFKALGGCKIEWKVAYLDEKGEETNDVTKGPKSFYLTPPGEDQVTFDEVSARILESIGMKKNLGGRIYSINIEEIPRISQSLDNLVIAKEKTSPVSQLKTALKRYSGADEDKKEAKEELAKLLELFEPKIFDAEFAKIARDAKLFLSQETKLQELANNLKLLGLVATTRFDYIGYDGEPTLNPHVGNLSICFTPPRRSRNAFFSPKEVALFDSLKMIKSKNAKIYSCSLDSLEQLNHSLQGIITKHIAVQRDISRVHKAPGMTLAIDIGDDNL